MSVFDNKVIGYTFSECIASEKIIIIKYQGRKISWVAAMFKSVGKGNKQYFNLGLSTIKYRTAHFLCYQCDNTNVIIIFFLSHWVFLHHTTRKINAKQTYGKICVIKRICHVFVMGYDFYSTLQFTI
jgi:hypothetical protein